MLSENRPDQPLALLAGLPPGRVTVLPPAVRPPPPGADCWQPRPSVVQVVVAGELPHLEAGGGIIGPRILRPGDVLVALAGSWSRRRYASERRLFSLTCLPGLPWLDLYHFIPPRRPDGRPPERYPLHAPPALRLVAEALAMTADAGAAADLGRALLGLVLRTAAIPRSGSDADLCHRARTWMADRTPDACSRRACATALGVHPDHLTRCLRRSGGSWNREFLELRLRTARERLLAGDAVTAVAHSCGWSSASHFVSVFRRIHGTTPQRWRSLQRAP